MINEKMTIACLKEHRIKKFEKDIRRYFKKLPEFQAEHNGKTIISSTYHVYFFKLILDKIYKEKELLEFPFDMLMVYSNIFTNRNLKTNEYIPKSDSDIESIDYIINNHQVFVMWIYDSNFPHKPDEPYCRIVCAVNPKRRAIIPMQFSRNLGEIYPKWFNDPLEQHIIPEVGIDFDLVERVKLVMT